MRVLMNMVQMAAVFAISTSALDEVRLVDRFGDRMSLYEYDD